MEDQKGLVALDELEGVTRIVAPGGYLGRNHPVPRMTLEEMKKVLGKRKIASKGPSRPNMDCAVVHEFDRPRQGTLWLAYLSGGLTEVALYWGVCAGGGVRGSHF